ncbi:DUF2752 domain-containing protein [Streptacidiphilus melanogenes]|uniref:DUF2752 domain-containing protein n=1 Tax=Streptacidiphilus melanogenes TaxID=411235 RepID=UPI00191C5387|nr:DUF2752 domain-containing protein [Streptacidiphilus melanogenes]
MSADQAFALGRRAALERRWAEIAAGRYGGPLRVLLRGGGAAVVAVVAAEVHRTHDPGVLCPLRRFTGIPCPGCGSTTVFMDLGAGHVGAAIAANPVTVLVGLGLLFAPLGGGAWWWRLPARKKNIVIFSAAAVSWLWQLHRYGFLPS